METVYTTLLFIVIVLLTIRLILIQVKYKKSINKIKEYNNYIIAGDIAIAILSITCIILAIILKKYFILTFYWFIPLDAIFRTIRLTKQNKAIIALETETTQ